MPPKPLVVALSNYDETVPENYIGIYSLFSDKKYALPGYEESWCIGEKPLSKMRRETYKAVKKRFDKCGADNFAKFWNGNVDAINDIGLNRFARLNVFEELATAMMCFENTVPNKTNNGKRKIISWGIRIDLYRNYYRSHLESVRTGNPPKKVSLYDAKKKRRGNICRFPQIKFEFMENGQNRVVRVDDNAVYEQFCHWCKVKKISKKSGLYQAMKLIMEQYPSAEVKDLAHYEKKCDLDYCEIVVPEVSTESDVSVQFRMSRELHDQVMRIIQRYNSDIENIGQPPMTLEKYMIQAAELLNIKSPLKYSNPKLEKEYREAKEAERYNKIVSEL